jgi:hypothetical protein
MTTLCNTFKRLAHNTWDIINESRLVNFQLKEETLTDINMLAIKQRHSRQVRTKVYNKNEEGIEGADWEWWFTGISGNWIGFRVQAKIINLQTDSFEHLHYQNPRTHIYQCDKLIQKALTRQHPKIPLYCFFIQTENSTHLNNWSCRTVPYLKDFYGCSLTSAFTVKQLRTTNSKHITHLQTNIKPWHCLVCCSGHGQSDFITNIQAYAKANFNLDKEIASGLNVVIPDDFSTQKPPDYVLAILENENNDNIIAPDEDIDGVMIFTEKE